ncbi:MAG: hypothetical protein MR991_03410 [Clostridiales bacterium]|nr:hypothetical protein [Clostridiales bacterium]
MTDNNLSFNELWSRKCRRIGMTLIPLIMISMFLPVLYLRIKYGVFPEWSVALSSWGTIAAAFATYYIVEPLSYYPILGLSGTYMAFTAGSISDIRMPASAVAQEAIGVPYGSKEGEVASTLGVAGSLFTTLVVVFLTAVFGTKLIALLPAALVAAIKTYTVPCVFAAVYVQLCKFEPKLSWLIVLTTILYFLLAKIYALFMVASVVLSVVAAWICYKKGLFRKEA